MGRGTKVLIPDNNAAVDQTIFEIADQVSSWNNQNSELKTSRLSESFNKQVGKRVVGNLLSGEDFLDSDNHDLQLASCSENNPKYLNISDIMNKSYLKIKTMKVENEKL